MGILLWLDDERPAPEGWIRIEKAAYALALIRRSCVSEASLDHDLGDDPYTGYWLLSEIEQDVALGLRYSLPTFTIHSANPVGRKNMEAAIASIGKLVKR